MRSCARDTRWSDTPSAGMGMPTPLLGIQAQSRRCKHCMCYHVYVWYCTPSRVRRHSTRAIAISSVHNWRAGLPIGACCSEGYTQFVMTILCTCGCRSSAYFQHATFSCLRAQVLSGSTLLRRRSRIRFVHGLQRLQAISSRLFVRLGRKQPLKLHSCNKTSLYSLSDSFGS